MVAAGFIFNTSPVSKEIKDKKAFLVKSNTE